MVKPFRLIYLPREDITVYELAMVLKIFTFNGLPTELKTMEVLDELYTSLPKEAKRHFQRIET